MTAYPCNPGIFHYNANPHSGTFRPQGRLTHHGSHVNPRDWQSTETLAARIIVGFNVGSVPTWSMDHLIPIVERERAEQVGDPSSTFIAQRGIYQHRDGKQIVTEDGAQVIIIDTRSTDAQEFEDQMVHLGEVICSELKQETVVVEIQRNGVTVKTMGIRE